MSNRINPMDQGLLGKIGSKVGETGSARKATTDSAVKDKEGSRETRSTDTVELTSGGKLLARLEKTLASLPEIDSGRVEAVKAQIEKGEFQIDADKIAEALLRTDRELGD